MAMAVMSSMLTARAAVVSAEAWDDIRHRVTGALHSVNS